MEHVILVNEKDEATGTMEKMEAHEKGLLHRAFSVFIFNSKGEMLLQRRAAGKYHSAGLWTNTCCSHPRPGEDTRDAAQRRLKEEMGLFIELNFLSVFTYKTEFGNGLTEHEVDHVYIGKTDADPSPNPAEVDSFCWKLTEDIKEELRTDPEKFTSWFRIAMEKLF
ncbi:MAG: isopentenyl-diphosphate Delta-isomerase [Bacteroidia bacterium]